MDHELARRAGKEAADLIEAVLDGLQPADVVELAEAAQALGTLKGKYPNTPKKAVLAHVLVGALEDLATDLFPLS